MGHVGWEKITAETLVNIVEKKGFPANSLHHLYQIQGKWDLSH
jgi:hypothetical protein